MSIQRQKRNRRARRARRFARLLKFVTILVLVLGIGSLGLWLLFDRHPEVTVQNYPVEYESLIRTYAAENGLQPAYVASVILAESSYRPEAVSSVNAQGLMQILPSTGEWIAGKFDETFAVENLFDPATNIRYGCWYLRFLMDRYGEDKKCASAAYHAGQGNVDRWLQDPAFSPDGTTLATISYPATNTYVNRVLANYERYAKIL